jgi:hypothetical protein
LNRRTQVYATILVSFALHAGSASAQSGRPNDVSGAGPAGMVVSPAVERAIALGRKKKSANHALVLRDVGQGFANAMAALSTPRWQAPATKSGLWLEIYTPLSWVSQQAATAEREYRGLEDVGNELREHVDQSELRQRVLRESRQRLNE